MKHLSYSHLHIDTNQLFIPFHLDLYLAGRDRPKIDLNNVTYVSVSTETPLLGGRKEGPFFIFNVFISKNKKSENEPQLNRHIPPILS
jgi:hypothetical protein